MADPAQDLRDMLDDGLQVKTLNVQPGDTVVFSHPQHLTVDQAKLLQEQGKHIWPDNKIAILAGGLEADVRRVAFDEDDQP